jgi:hypothetical protein
MTDHIKSLETRHIHVEYRRYKIGISAQDSVGFAAIKGRHNPIAFILYDGCHHTHDQRIVFRHQYPI